jgi:hypothetical protein
MDLHFTVQDLDVTSSGGNMCRNSMTKPRIDILTTVQFGDHVLLSWKFYLSILDTIQIISVHLISTSILLSFSLVCFYGCILVTFSATSGYHMPALLICDSAQYFFVCCTILSVSQTVLYQVHPDYMLILSQKFVIHAGYKPASANDRRVHSLTET